MCAGLATSGGARANGGGYTTGVKFTGSVAPFQPQGVEAVQIAKEHLDIVLGPESAAVTMRYEMKNVSGKAAKARFGYPSLPCPTGDTKAPPKSPTANANGHAG